jgi:hypothetical protein
VDAAKTKPPGARAATAMAKAYEGAADAPATLRAYTSDLKNYQTWRARHTLQLATDGLLTTILSTLAGAEFSLYSVLRPRLP